MTGLGRAKQVILLQHIPRFDIEENDPMGVRPELARLANMELERARDASSQAQHIMVGQHAGLECEGKTRDDRFTSNHTYGRNKNVRMGKYDGLHMYSQEGAEALTKSLLTTSTLRGWCGGLRDGACPPPPPPLRPPPRSGAARGPAGGSREGTGETTGTGRGTGETMDSSRFQSTICSRISARYGRGPCSDSQP